MEDDRQKIFMMSLPQIWTLMGSKHFPTRELKYSSTTITGRKMHSGHVVLGSNPANFFGTLQQNKDV